MRILVFGASGQIGTALMAAFTADPSVEVLAATRSGFFFGDPCIVADFLDQKTLRGALRTAAPDLVVNAAAYTAVELAEVQPDLAFEVNAVSVRCIAETCSDMRIPLIHYSTDYVFNGQSTTPYAPNDPTNPLNVYGASKLAGEIAIRETGCQHLILRTAWVYGNHGLNFLKTMLRLAQSERAISVVNDQVGCPTPSWLIGQRTAQVVAQGFLRSGTYHLTSLGQTTWAGFAEAIFDNFETGCHPTLIGIPSSEFKSRVQRPAYSVLDTKSWQEMSGLSLPDWRDALRTTARRIA